MDGHKSGIYSVTYAKDGGAIASGGSDKDIHIWDP